MKTIRPLLLRLLFFLLVLPAVSKADHADDQDIKLLLSRLDVDRAGMEQVRQSAGDLQSAGKHLLTYFRRRSLVKHPIDRTAKTTFFGETPDEKDLKWADEALEHVFVGQPAYPSHFCGDDINWNSRPVPDMEWVWQLNRMYFWNAMGRVYWQTGDEKYAEEWCRQLLDWTRKNPNDAEHKYAWRSIETGIRGYNWPGLFQRFIDAPSFSSEVLVAFLNSCYEHAEFLMTKYKSGSNWGLMEAEGMAFIAITFPEFKQAEAWRTEAFRRLNNEINIQVYPDGHQRELAMGYHLGCIRWFLRTYELAKMNGLDTAFPASYLEAIEKMCEVPMKLCMPDGTNVQFGDAWVGTPGQHKEKFEEWAASFERDDFLYLATEGKEGVTPESTAFALEKSGLYSMRSSWDKDAICLVLKCGPDGGGHSQPDNGTFDLYAGGRNLMPDAGSYIYSGNPEGRAWFRQTQVHQTLTLNGENSRYAPKLLLWKPGKELDVLVVENESYEQLTHRRAVFFVDKRYFIIVDEAYGSAVGDVDIHFQLAPGAAIFDQDDLAVASDFSEGWNVFVQAKQQENLKLEEELGQVSFVYTKKEERPAFRYRIAKTSAEHSIRIITKIIPFQDEPAELKVHLEEASNVPGSSIRLGVREGGELRQIGYQLGVE